jgi:hypothetical protein
MDHSNLVVRMQCTGRLDAAMRAPWVPAALSTSASGKSPSKWRTAAAQACAQWNVDSTCRR